MELGGRNRRRKQWSMSRPARSKRYRLRKFRRSNSIIRTAGGRPTSSRRTPKSSPSNTPCTAIAIGLVALVLSWLMRLQLGFPGTFDFITPEAYYQFITMHGMIMVIYLAHRAVSRWLWQLPDPADGRGPGHGLSLCQHAELLDLSARRSGAGSELLRAGRADGRWVDALPAAGHSWRNAGRAGVGHHPDARHR